MSRRSAAVTLCGLALLSEAQHACPCWSSENEALVSPLLGGMEDMILRTLGCLVAITRTEISQAYTRTSTCRFTRHVKEHLLAQLQHVMGACTVMLHPQEAPLLSSQHTDKTLHCLSSLKCSRRLPGATGQTEFNFPSFMEKTVSFKKNVKQKKINKKKDQIISFFFFF